MGWKTWVKRSAFRLAYYSGLEVLIARTLPVNAAAILMYHGVCDNSCLPGEVDFHLKIPAFERHMRMLKRRYPVVPLETLLDRLERGERLRKEIVLTFDDGYRNNATLAHPVLARHGLPYTIYLSTAYIGGEAWLPLNELYGLWYFGRIDHRQVKELRQRMRGLPASQAGEILRPISPPLTPAEREQARDSFQMLTWDEVRDLCAAGVEFGSHTHTHCNMAAETPLDRESELRTARQRIAEETGKAPPTFAYPFGRPENWNEQTRQDVIHAGHRCAILAKGGLAAPGQDLFSLPRASYFEETWYFACHLMLLFLKHYFRQ